MPREPADKELGPALRELRLKAGLTQEDVADGAGIGVTSLSRIETCSANPTWTTVMRILDAMDRSLTDLSRQLQHP